MNTSYSLILVGQSEIDGRIVPNSLSKWPRKLVTNVNTFRKFMSGLY
jgi:hypothetical protein